MSKIVLTTKEEVSVMDFEDVFSPVAIDSGTELHLSLLKDACLSEPWYIVTNGDKHFRGLGFPESIFEFYREVKILA